jgi:hypothetical protein
MACDETAAGAGICGGVMGLGVKGCGAHFSVMRLSGDGMRIGHLRQRGYAFACGPVAITARVSDERTKD